MIKDYRESDMWHPFSQRNSQTLSAEKITHPFQLMAAWFVMLIMLDGLFLEAALRIKSPGWGAGFLIISSVCLSLVVMTAVFTMLTAFRPHLQGPKEYASWLKDERKFSSNYVLNESSSNVSQLSFHVSDAPISTGLAAKTRVGLMEVSDLRGAQKVVSKLTELGFRANIYESPFPDQKPPLRISEHKAIWIGSDVPAEEAILSIKSVISIWPQLCYLHLSNDSGAPDYVHQQMFFGGATKTAEEDGLLKWSKSEIEAIQSTLSLSEWHTLVRSKYGIVEADYETEPED